ncbi:amidohydrolase [Mycobacterium scrofulaceum]|uniref:Amidohydrolase n=2 Tax=Mycobacterium scrofulaceum TaxID=1783 RepID=A0A1X0KFZ4_MYCSC|nr:amidohydrolase [Mycobacterium scrofulaceum]
MRLICIEEHTMDADIMRRAQPTLEEEAPYMGLQSSAAAASQSADRDRPHLVEMREAIRRGSDLADRRIAEMDAHGIDMQIISYSSPIQLVPEEHAVELAASANDRLGQAISQYPNRFGGFALLPWQAPQAAAEELERAVVELGLKGALIVGRPGARFLDDRRYDPVLQKLNDLRVPLYVHPFHPVPSVQQAYYSGFGPEVTTQFSLGGWGWHHEAGIHVLRLILSGAFERFPHLRVISGHWGEMVPFYLPRLDDVMPPNVTGLSTTITDTYCRHVWITPSGMFYEPHIDFIAQTVGLDRLIWSVDYPYLTLDGTRTFLNKLNISEDDRHRIAHRNAEDLLSINA